jgi:hypothetical protein
MSPSYKFSVVRIPPEPPSFCIIGLLAKFQMDTRQFSLRGCDQSDVQSLTNL